MQTPSNLFVYGTLAPGRPNEHILGKIGGQWQKATVRGTLHEEGWGASMGYPAIVLDNDADEVEGFLFTSHSLAKHWQSLDEFEGKAYERVVTTVSLNNNESTQANIYVLKNR